MPAVELSHGVDANLLRGARAPDERDAEHQLPDSLTTHRTS